MGEKEVKVVNPLDEKPIEDLVRRCRRWLEDCHAFFVAEDEAQTDEGWREVDGPNRPNQRRPSCPLELVERALNPNLVPYVRSAAMDDREGLASRWLLKRVDGPAVRGWRKRWLIAFKVSHRPTSDWGDADSQFRRDIEDIDDICAEYIAHWMGDTTDREPPPSLRHSPRVPYRCGPIMQALRLPALQALGSILKLCHESIEAFEGQYSRRAAPDPSANRPPEIQVGIVVRWNTQEQMEDTTSPRRLGLKYLSLHERFGARPVLVQLSSRRFPKEGDGYEPRFLDGPYTRINRDFDRGMIRESMGLVPAGEGVPASLLYCDPTLGAPEDAGWKAERRVPRDHVVGHFQEESEYAVPIFLARGDESGEVIGAIDLQSRWPHLCEASCRFLDEVAKVVGPRLQEMREELRKSRRLEVERSTDRIDRKINEIINRTVDENHGYEETISEIAEELLTLNHALVNQGEEGAGDSRASLSAKHGFSVYLLEDRGESLEQIVPRGYRGRRLEHLSKELDARGEYAGISAFAYSLGQPVLWQANSREEARPADAPTESARDDSDKVPSPQVHVRRESRTGTEPTPGLERDAFEIGRYRETADEIRSALTIPIRYRAGDHSVGFVLCLETVQELAFDDVVVGMFFDLAKKSADLLHRYKIYARLQRREDEVRMTRLAVRQMRHDLANAERYAYLLFDALSRPENKKFSDPYLNKEVGHSYNALKAFVEVNRQRVSSLEGSVEGVAAVPVAANGTFSLMMWHGLFWNYLQETSDDYPRTGGPRDDGAPRILRFARVFDHMVDYREVFRGKPVAMDIPGGYDGVQALRGIVENLVVNDLKHAYLREGDERGGHGVKGIAGALKDGVITKYRVDVRYDEDVYGEREDVRCSPEVRQLCLVHRAEWIPVQLTTNGYLNPHRQDESVGNIAEGLRHFGRIEGGGVAHLVRSLRQLRAVESVEKGDASSPSMSHATGRPPLMVVCRPAGTAADAALNDANPCFRAYADPTLHRKEWRFLFFVRRSRPFTLYPAGYEAEALGRGGIFLRRADELTALGHRDRATLPYVVVATDEVAEEATLRDADFFCLRFTGAPSLENLAAPGSQVRVDFPTTHPMLGTMADIGPSDALLFHGHVPDDAYGEGRFVSSWSSGARLRTLYEANRLTEAEIRRFLYASQLRILVVDEVLWGRRGETVRDRPNSEKFDGRHRTFFDYWNLQRVELRDPAAIGRADLLRPKWDMVFVHRVHALPLLAGEAQPPAARNRVIVFSYENADQIRQLGNRFVWKHSLNRVMDRGDKVDLVELGLRSVPLM